MSIYLDNSATTRTDDEVTDYMVHVMKDVYGNPSSMHSAGVDAENEVKKAADIIAKELKVSPKEILFTSGGTESDNIAVIGSAMANRRKGMHLITTATEHPAITETMKYLEEQGFDVTYLGVKKNGKVDPSELEAALTDKTVLVSIMHVNNEIGSVNDIAQLAKIVKKHDPSILFHTDAVQSFGKLRIYPKRENIDLMSVSAHKIHGPKGIGFLYIDEKAKIRPVSFGGGQQKGMRPGTENVPAIAGMGVAVQKICSGLEESAKRLYGLKKYFALALSELENVTINGVDDINDIESTAPHIVSASFEGVRAEVLLHTLEANGIFVSSGSACSSNKPSRSRTLLAIGLDPALADSTIRFSFSVETKKEELDRTIGVLKNELPKLRKYSRH